VAKAAGAWVLAGAGSDERVGAAMALGADAGVNYRARDLAAECRALTDGRGVDVVITAAAAGKAQEDGLQMLARGGRLSAFGGLPKDKPAITVDANLVHYRELTIVGANGSSPDHNKEALRLIASGEVPVKDLITHRLGLDDVRKALDIVASGEAIKVTIEP
jgi:L-iditol 2-dehydrogenase